MMLNKSFALLALLAAFAVAIMPGQAFAESPAAKPAEPAKPAVEYQQLKGKIRILIGGKLFTEFVYDGTQKPYLYPIVGPTGAKMTRGYPVEKALPGESKDHPHHTSLWFAHGNIGGVDYWHMKKGSPALRLMGKPKIATPKGGDKAGGAHSSLTAAYSWPGKAGPLLLSNLGVRAVVLDDGSRAIDYFTTLTPVQPPLVFGDTKEGTMAIRVHPALRLKGKVATGKCINSNGDKDGKCWGKRAKWVAYWGKVDGKVCGVAVFDHPTNLRHPTWWHARDYGLVAANPFGVSDFERIRPRGKGKFTLNKGEKLSLKYRFVFYEGDAKQADIAGKYDQWVKQTTAKPTEKADAKKPADK